MRKFLLAVLLALGLASPVQAAYNTSSPSVINPVTQFHASGNNSTPNDAAFAAMFTQITANGGGIVAIPAGTYKFTTCGLVMPNNIHFSGSGQGVTILSFPTLTCGNHLFIGTPSNSEFDHFTCQGGTTAPTTTGGVGCFLFTGGSNNEIHDVEIKNIDAICSGWTSVPASASKLKFRNNYVHDCNADGFYVSGIGNYEASGNQIWHVGDNGLSWHVDGPATAPLMGSVHIHDNHLVDTKGIQVIDMKGSEVNGNIFEVCKGVCITVFPSVGAHQGFSSTVGANIHDNVGTDIVNDSYTGGGNIADYILISPYAQKGSLAAEVFRPVSNTPQVPWAGSGSGYVYTQGYNSATATVAGGYGIQIHHNNFQRTLPPGTPSSWGSYLAPNGLMTETGYKNSAISDSDLQGTGVGLSGEVHSGSISDNIFSPGRYCLFITIQGNTIPQTLEELDFSRNSCLDTESGGIGTDATTTPQFVDLRIEDNWFDGDPFFKVGNHNADGTWTNTGAYSGITATSLVGLHIGGNRFKNFLLPIHEDGNSIYEFTQTNWVYVGTPTALNFSGGNGGIGTLPAMSPGAWGYIVYDANPNHAAYGEVSNYAPSQCTQTLGTPDAITGYHVQGWRCQIVNPTVAASDTNMIDLYRATTNNSNIMGTDWIVEKPQ